ncbi:unnamed protein product [Adineta ricciae]|uniref:Uncharacterized protein n=2 Tax=Adineta ricciae TaxID=249248 RepID=A0A814RU64_ADIRI|nr:unnamed protein product [Adineta ricciae]
MLIRDICGFILSIFVTGATLWACSFKVEHVVMGELATAPGGKYNFLTILNLHLQVVYFGVCILNFFLGTNTVALEKRSLLQKLRDFLFAGAAFPIGMFVCITFWGLYHIDRKLIHPKEIDGLISPLLNHAMHTLPGVAICLESLFHYHRYPSRILGLLSVVSISIAYVAWIHYLHHILWLKMPVEKITLTHRFGIISSTYKAKLAKNLQEKGEDTDRSASSNTSDGHKKHLLLEVTEEFVQDYNRATPGERIKKNDTIYRMLQRLKRKSAQYQSHTNGSMQLQMAWAELCLLSQCKSKYQEECLTTLYRALIYSPLDATQIPTLFFLSETILYWVKNDAVLEPFLTSTELKLLKIAQIIFQLLYFHYLEGSTEPYEEFKVRLYSYLDGEYPFSFFRSKLCSNLGLDECESAYSSYPNAVWCIRYIESVGSVVVASVGRHPMSSRCNVSSVASFPIPEIPPEDSEKTNKSELRAQVQELSPTIWYSVELWSFVKKHSTTNLSESLNQYFNDVILALVRCRYKLLEENWIDIVITFQILADLAKTNVDALETIQLLAQSEPTTQLMSHGWRSWSWQLIVLLCECLTSIGIGSDQAVIKRTILFGNETSSDTILAYARNTDEQSMRSNHTNDNVCLMHMFSYRATDNDDLSWRIRYMALLCMSQLYKHLQTERRHKTLSNLLWMFIHEYEQYECDNRILEALKVGRFDDDIIQSVKYDLTESQSGTIYTSIAQRFANGILPRATPSDLQTPQPKTQTNKFTKASQNASSPQNTPRIDQNLLPTSAARLEKKPILVKQIIKDNINDVFKRKGQVFQSIVIDQYRKQLEENKEETADVIEQLDSMIDKAKKTTTLNENLLSSILAPSNKKFICDPLQERRALNESMGQSLITDE